MKTNAKRKGMISNANINIITESVIFFIVAFAAFGADNFWIHAVTGLSVGELSGRNLDPSKLLAGIPLLALWIPLLFVCFITIIYLLAAISFPFVSVIEEKPIQEPEISLDRFHERLLFAREIRMWIQKIRPNITSVTIGLLASLSISAVYHWNGLAMMTSPLVGALLGFVHMNVAEKFGREWKPEVPLSAREALMTLAARRRKRYLMQIAVGRRLPES